MYKYFHKRRGILAPHQPMWQALGEGILLRKILSDFYNKVYSDPRLSLFFSDITIDRAIDKQFSFLRSIFTGEKCYFGDHPKNAHHWMVITDDLFDYRETLMENTLRKHGLNEDLIDHWRQIEEAFRRAIVKNKALPRKMGGIEVPIDGYSTIELEVSTLCDNCQQEILLGHTVSYHNRTGKVFCSSCLDAQTEINHAAIK